MYVPFEQDFPDTDVVPGAATTVYFAQDYLEQQKLQGFYPSGSGTDAPPWWASLATYGVTRAIDAAVGPTITGGGGSTFAGQNGRTYPNAGGTIGGIDTGMLLLIGLAVAAVVVMSD